jgi:hypothetical protein
MNEPILKGKEKPVSSESTPVEPTNDSKSTSKSFNQKNTKKCTRPTLSSESSDNDKTKKVRHKKIYN